MSHFLWRRLLHPASGVSHFISSRRESLHLEQAFSFGSRRESLHLEKAFSFGIRRESLHFEQA